MGYETKAGRAMAAVSLSVFAGGLILAFMGGGIASAILIPFGIAGGYSYVNNLGKGKAP